MFNWIKDIFKPKLGSTEYLHFDCKVPMPKCKPTRKDGESPQDYKIRVGLNEELYGVKKSDVGGRVSEPVLSFIEAVYKNPKRFAPNIVYKDMIGNWSTVNSYSIFDRLTKKMFRITIVGIYGHYYTPCENCLFLTTEECKLLIYELSNLYTKRSERLKQLKNDRQRRALTKVYGKVK